MRHAFCFVGTASCDRCVDPIKYYSVQWEMDVEYAGAEMRVRVEGTHQAVAVLFADDRAWFDFRAWGATAEGLRALVCLLGGTGGDECCLAEKGCNVMSGSEWAVV